MTSHTSSAYACRRLAAAGGMLLAAVAALVAAGIGAAPAPAQVAGYTVTFEGTQGADTISVAINSAGSLELCRSADPAYPECEWHSINDVQNIVINGLEGDDTFLIDHANRFVGRGAGLSIDLDGGGGSLDVLEICPAGCAGKVASSTYDFAIDRFTQVAPGEGAVEPDAEALVISHSGLYTVVDGSDGDAEIAGSDAAESITLNESDPGFGIVSVDAKTTYEFSGKGNVLVNALAGDDTIVQAAGFAPAGAESLHYSGGGGANSLAVAAADDQPVTYRPGEPAAAVKSGTLERSGLDLSFDTVDDFVFDGLGHSVAVTVATPVGRDSIIFTPTSSGGGSVSVRRDTSGGDTPGVALVPFTYRNVAVRHPVTIDDESALREDSVFVAREEGEAPSDRISITGDHLTLGVGDGSSVAVPLVAASADAVTIRSGRGNDAVDATSPFPFALGYDGGEGTDEILLRGAPDVAGEIVDVSPSAGTVGGFGKGVAMREAEILVVEAGGRSAAVRGSASGDDLRVGAVASNTYRVEHAGVALVSDVVEAASLRVIPEDGSDSVAVAGTAGGDDMTVERGGTPVVRTAALSAPVVIDASTEAVTAAGLGGDDRIRVEGGGGPTVRIDGGDGVDRLAVDAHDVSVDTTINRITATGDVFDHLNVEALFAPGDTGSGGTLDISATDAPDAIAQVGREVTVGTSPVIAYGTFGVLRLRAGGGDDSVALAPASAAVATIDVLGGPAAGDRVVVRGTPSADELLARPTAGDAASVTLGSGGVLPVTISLAAVEGLSFEGGGGGDAARVEGTDAADELAAEPRGVDAATLRVGPLLPVDVAGLGGGAIAIDGRLGNDALRVATAATADRVDVDGAGIVAVRGVEGVHVPLSVASVERLDLSTMGGDDTTTVDALHPFRAVVVDGGEGNADELVVNGGRGPLTVDLAHRDVTESAPVHHGGIERVSIHAAGAPVTAQSGAADDELRYTPLGPAAARVALAGEPAVDVHGLGGDLLLDGAGGADAATIDGTSAADVVSVARGSTTVARVVGGPGVALAPSIEAMRTMAGDGDDRFDVSGAGGPASVVLDGGTGGDRLTVAGTDGAVSYGPGIGDATVTTDSTDLQSRAIEVISLSGSGTGGLRVEGTGGDDRVQLGGDRVRVNDAPPVDYLGFKTVLLNGRTGDDAFTVVPAGLTSDRVDVDGGASGAGDRVLVVGTAARDLIAVTPEPPAADGRGAVQLAGQPLVHYASAERVDVDGGGGGDALTVSGTASQDDITVTAGPVADAGAVQVRTFAPFGYAALGPNGALTIDGAGDNDLLTVAGSAGADALRVAPGGDVSRLGFVPVSTAGIERLAVDALAGNDDLNVAGNHPYTAVAVDGGEPAGTGDVLTVAGGGGPLAVDLGARRVTEVAPIDFRALEDLHVDAAAASVHVLGSAAPDAFRFTPTSAASALLAVPGDPTAVRLTRLGSPVHLDGREGSDRSTFVARARADGIEVDRGATTTVSIPDLVALRQAVSVESLTIEAGDGSDEIGVGGAGGPSSLVVDAGSGTADRLRLSGQNVVATFAATPGGGFLAAPGNSVEFSGTELVNVDGDGLGRVTVAGSGISDTVSQTLNQVRIGATGVLTYADYAELAIDGQGGDDLVSIAPDGAGVERFVVRGGASSAGDVLVVRARPLGDQGAYRPVGPTAGDVALAGLPRVSFDGVENLAYEGQGGDDHLTVSGSGNDDAATFTPGSLGDAGTLGVPGTVPLRFSGLGAGGSTTFAAAAGADALVVNASPFADQLAVDNTGSTLASGRVPVRVADVEGLTVVAAAGDDSVRVAADHPFQTITVDGGDASDAVAFAGSGGAVAIDLGAATVRQAPFGVVRLAAVEALAVDAAGGAITTAATSGDDILRYSPATSTSATVLRDGSRQVTTVQRAASFTLDAAAGADQVVVNGTPAAEAVTTARGATTIVSVGSLLPVMVLSPAAESLMVAAAEGDDALTVRGVGGPVSLAMDAGAGTDRMKVEATAVTLTFDFTRVGGVVGAPSSFASFSSVEAVELAGSGTGDVSVVATAAADQVTAVADRVDLGGGSTVTHHGYRFLRLDAGPGDDSLRVAPAGSPVLGILVAGGDSSAGDQLAVVDGPDARRTDVWPREPAGGDVSIADAPAVSFSAVEALAFDGQGGGDHVVVDGTPAADAFTLTPGATGDSGRVHMGSFVPVEYRTLGAGGALTVAGGDGGDGVELLGSPLTDAVAVDTLGTVAVAGRIPVSQESVEQLAVRTGGGDDRVDAAGRHPYADVLIDGGDSADSVVVAGSGDEVAVALAGPSVTAGQHGAVRLAAVEALTADAAAAAVSVTGSDAADSIRYTPSTATSGVATRDGTTLTATFIGGRLSLDPGLGADSVTVTATSAGDAVTVDRGTTTAVSVAPLLALSVPAATESLTVAGATGDDTFGVRGVGGPAALALDAGPGADRLAVEATDALAQGDIGNGVGRLVLDGAALTHTGFARIDAAGTGSGALTLVGSSAGDVLTQVGPAVTPNAGPGITFAGYHTLSLDAGAGDDVVSTAPDGAGVASIEVAGAEGSGDRLTVTGRAGADQVTVAPTGASSASVTVASLPPVQFRGVEAASYGGAGGGDELLLLATSGEDVITSDPDGTDAGTLRVGTSVPLQYSALGAGGLVVDGSGGADQLVQRGTAAADSTTVAADGTIAASAAAGARVPVRPLGVEQLTVEQLAGADRTTIAGLHPFGAVHVDGGGAGDGDELRFSGGGGAITLAAAGSRIAEGAPVTFTSVSALRVDAAAGDVTALGTSGPDAIRFIPLATSSARTTVEGSPLTVTYADLGSLTVDPAGGADRVVADATTAADSITLARGATTTVGVGALQPVRLPASAEAVHVQGLEGDDVVSVTGTGGPATVLFDGGLGTDEVRAAGSVLGVRFAEGTQIAGTLDIDGTPLAFASTEKLEVRATTSPSSFRLDGTSAADTITQDGDRFSVGGFQLGITGFDTVELAAGAGADRIVTSPLSSSAKTLVVAGGGPGGPDVLAVNGLSGSDSLSYRPSGLTSGSVTGQQGAAIQFSEIEALEVAGQSTGATGDILTVDTSALGGSQVVQPGSAGDVGTVELRDGTGAASTAPAMAFSSLGAGRLAFADDRGRIGRLTYRGTSSNDTFTVDGGGTVVQGKAIPVTTAGSATLLIDALDGVDLVEVAAAHPFPGEGGAAGVQAAGGSPDLDDRLLVRGSGGAPLTLDYATRVVAEQGAASTVAFDGFDAVDVDAGGRAVTAKASGTAGDMVCTMPQSPSSAQLVQLAAAPGTSTGACTPSMRAGTPLYGISGTPVALTVDPGAGADEIVVSGTAVSDVVRVRTNDSAVPGFASVQIDPEPAAGANPPALLPVRIPVANAERVRVATGEGYDVVHGVVLDAPTMLFTVDADTPTAKRISDTLSLCGLPPERLEFRDVHAYDQGYGSVEVAFKKSVNVARFDYLSLETVKKTKRAPLEDGTCPG